MQSFRAFLRTHLGQLAGPQRVFEVLATIGVGTTLGVVETPIGIEIVVVFRIIEVAEEIESVSSADSQRHGNP